MRTRSIEILPDHFYHIYNRGNNKQSIFRGKRDFQFFLKRMAHYFSKACIDVIAYSLMPNHFHLLVQITQEVDFHKIMKSFSISYVKSFHLWHKTSGHLYEDDYQAKCIKSDRHLIQVIPYMHLNPVMAGIVEQPEDWTYSDCRAWCFEQDVFPFNSLRRQLYGSPEGYREYLKEYAARKREIREIERMLLGLK